MTNKSSGNKGPNVYSKWHKSKGSHVSMQKKNNKGRQAIIREYLATKGLNCSTKKAV